MQLEEVDYKEFKKVAGTSYKKDFPREERVSFRLLKKSYQQGNLQFLLLREEEVYAYAILIQEKEYRLIFYLATFSKERGKGYGSKMLQQLRDKYPESTIFIEVERQGYGKNENENEIRKKRIAFYKKNNFLEIDLVGTIWGTDYEIYAMKNSQKFKNGIQQEMIEIEKEIYTKLMGKKLTQKFVKLETKTKDKENIY